MLLLNDAANGGDGNFSVNGGLPDVDVDVLGLVLTDVTGDAHPDLYLANASGGNLLLVNNGSGLFADESVPMRVRTRSC